MELGIGPILSSVPSLFSRDTQKQERKRSDGAFVWKIGTVVYSAIPCCVSIEAYFIVDVENISGLYLQFFWCAWDVGEVGSDIRCIGQRVLLLHV